MKSLTYLLLSLLWLSKAFANERLNIDVIAINYPPYTSPSAPDYGSNFSLLSKYAKSHLRVSITPLFLPPARANRIIKDGHWCLSFYPPRNDNKLSRFVSLSDNLVSIGFYRLKKKESFQWSKLEELSGKMVAILRSNIIGKIHQSLINAGLKIVYVETIEQGLQLVLKSRVDYAFGDNLVLSETSLSEDQKRKLQFSESSFHTAKIGFFYNSKCENKLFVSP
jgi:polar amino acid transport system substrate-binding protein